MRSLRQLALSAALAWGCAPYAFAQDEFSSNPLSSNYVLLFLGAFVAVFLLLILVIILRKVRGVRRADMVFGMTIDDVGNLKQKGLLTEEESKAVKQALARQFARQHQIQTAGQKPADLLADPEIIRLQQQAEERRRATVDQLAAAANRQQTDAPPPAPQTQASPAPASAEDEEGDVQLPPDVLTMAELGLITAEELESIKRRTRERKRAL